ncbi:MAG TPA: vWA domain-containing protein [Planctomycetaceae bacterium]|nr:vWA domain-containing protein [Planctomycetaceae bacterium]
MTPTSPSSEARSLRRSLPASERETFTSVRDVPAWLASLVVHAALLLLLATIVHTTILERHPEITSTIEDDELDPEVFQFDSSVTDEVGSDSELQIVSPSKAAAPEAGQNPLEELERPLNEDVKFEMPVIETLEIAAAEFTDVIAAEGATEHVGGVPGAMDRLTWEIANTLRTGKTLVVWLFDASGSLTERRAAIADRFELVYKQLGQVQGSDETDADKALKTAVVTYAAAPRLITDEPLDDVSEVVRAVRGIQSDMSTSKENVVAALQLVMKRFRPYRTQMRRNVMIIIVTDERGDDYAAGDNYAPLETTINQLAKLGVRVYCVGNAAPFGREQGYVTWKYEDGFTEELPVDQGPETVFPERLQLGFWGARGDDLDRMTSSFGPYALTRICRETGGLYLVAAESERGPKFDPSLMRGYQPDYRPVAVYAREMVANKAKAALVQAARASRATDIPNLQTVFNAPDDNTLRQALSAAQEPAARLDYPLEGLHRLLAEGERDRPKLTNPRWRASFDLAIGRVLAMRVRAYGYNVVLANMRSNPRSFEKQDSNQWRLVPSRTVDANSTVRKYEKDALMYLNRVVDEHPGTPWARIAERELSTPLGWEWTEHSVPMARPGQNPNNPDEPRLLLADEERQREMRRQQEMRDKPRTRPNL